MSQKPTPSSRTTFRIDPVFAGKRTIVLAGGPSVTASAVHKIAKAKLDFNSNIAVIAVNDAVFLAWWADWLHACDQKWWNWHVNRMRGFDGIRTTLSPGVSEKWAGFLQETGSEGFDSTPGCIRHGSNGAYQALHCAMVAGSRSIGLLGVDLTDDGHWHEPHPMDVSVDRLKTMGPKFSTIMPAARAMGVNIWNLSGQSRLDAFPKKALEDFLNG